jgi:serine/threonine-protein kinase
MTESVPAPLPIRRRLIRAVRLIAAYTATVLAAAFVTVRLTARGSTVVVPSIAGMDLKQVQQSLRERGLEMEVSGEEWNETYPAGSVMGQQPASGSRVKRGRRVKLTLSRGSEIVQMPQLADMKLSEAQFLLRQLGLEIAGEDTVPSAYPRRTVIAHEPSAGAKVGRGQPVILLVSDGPPPQAFPTPKVTGLPTRDALAKLRSAGLNIAEVAYDTTTVYAEGSVFFQNPPAGFRAIKGDEARLRAARGAATGQARWISFRFALSSGPARRLRVLIVDEGGTREIANEIEEGGSVKRFETRVQGEAVAQFYVGGGLAEERSL